jgi:glucose-1-phosphatase
MNFNNIKNIIFDLGNVVIDIAPIKTYQAFAELSASKNAIEIESIIKDQKLWHNYEKGLLTDAEFRDLIRQNLDIKATDKKIDDAFNALLLDIDPERIKLIDQLREHYRIFVLSNTSKIHMIEFENILLKCTGRKDFWGLFEKPYLSYEMGKLKPESDIYQTVLNTSNLLPEETLFIDDLFANVESAKALNINTIHLQYPETIHDIPFLNK